MARHPECEMIYETFSNFTELCLIQDKSLLWPDEDAWTLENLEAIKKEFIDKPLWEGEYWDKIKIQFGSLNDLCWKALADALFIYTLPSGSMSPEKKYSLIRDVTDFKGFSLPDYNEPMWDVLHQGFIGTTMQYHLKYKQLWLLFLFAIEIKNMKDRINFLKDHKEVKIQLDAILNNIPEKNNRAWDMNNAIMHLAFPNLYEHTIHDGHKIKIVSAFVNRVPHQYRNSNLDEQLLLIRKNFEENEFQDEYFSFYLPTIKSQWFDKKNNGGGLVLEPIIEEFIPLLRRSKQIILYGPPGTGKTYYAIKLAREVIAQDNFEKSYSELDVKDIQKIKFDENLGDTHDGELPYLYICTFHPAFGYEEFIEGFRPDLQNGTSIGFSLREGIFKRICKKAINNPGKTYILVIDEINRGNIPRIFGELITLIEKDKRWIHGKSDNIGLILPTSGDVFYVPSNVLLIGTMNTADRSISLIDIALRRRFSFRELMPMPELLDNQIIAGLNLGIWLRELNKRIAEEVGRNLQVGHSYLMERGEPIEEISELSARLQNDIIPLLQEYCYDDYNKLANILGKAIVNVDTKSFNLEAFKAKKQENLIKVLKEMCRGD